MLPQKSHRGRSYPGERDPSHFDVEVANESPEPAFLSNFKQNLLSAYPLVARRSDRHISHHNGRTQRPSEGWKDHKNITFPLAVLSDFPDQLPKEEEQNQWRHIFLKAAAADVFLTRLPLPPSTHQHQLAPPLHFALACLGCVHVGKKFDDDALKLFFAGADLWLVIIEVDNREARSIEMLNAVISQTLSQTNLATDKQPVMKGTLLVTYGMLASNNESAHKRAMLLLCSSLTIARRMRLHNQLHSDQPSAMRLTSKCALLWNLWLADVIQALHLDLPLVFSSLELQTSLPSSTHSFQSIYRMLLQGSERETDAPSAAIPEDIRSEADAMLLLIAIISDSIYLRRSLGGIANANPRHTGTDIRRQMDPFTPFSSHMEFKRMENVLSDALDRWQARFNGLVCPEILALYYYSRLHLACPELADLSPLVGYNQTESSLTSASMLVPALDKLDIQISDQATHYSWNILDAVSSGLKNAETLCPVWLPVVTFHASLVIWARMVVEMSTNGYKYGSMKALLAFKLELEAMPWPCCVPMATTLESLMSNPHNIRYGAEFNTDM